MQGRMPWLLHQGGDAGWGDWSTVLPPMHLSAQFAVCEGADFQRNSILSEGKTFIEAPVLPKKLQVSVTTPLMPVYSFNHLDMELDVSAAAVAPDAWLSCSDECKLAWTRQWLASHMPQKNEGQMLDMCQWLTSSILSQLRAEPRPLLINAVLSHGPPSRRAALLELVISYMKDAAEQGLPVAGVLKGRA
eukprot:1140754-Pelagomonas_calceolata.AAC.7